jgi:hypothetical protein
VPKPACICLPARELGSNQAAQVMAGFQAPQVFGNVVGKARMLWDVFRDVFGMLLGMPECFWDVFVCDVFAMFKIQWDVFGMCLRCSKFSGMLLGCV